MLVLYSNVCYFVGVTFRHPLLQLEINVLWHFMERCRGRHPLQKHTPTHCHSEEHSDEESWFRLIRESILQMHISFETLQNLHYSLLVLHYIVYLIDFTTKNVILQ